MEGERVGEERRNGRRGGGARLVKRKVAGSALRFGSPFSSKLVIHGQSRNFALLQLINETENWLTSLAHLNAEIILSGGDSVAVRYNPPLPSYCR